MFWQGWIQKEKSRSHYDRKTCYLSVFLHSFVGIRSRESGFGRVNKHRRAIVLKAELVISWNNMGHDCSEALGYNNQV